MRKAILPLLIIAFSMIEVPDTIAWEGFFTHPAFTESSIGGSIVGDYLKTQMGFKTGVQTKLELDFSFYLNVKKPIEAGENDPSKTTRIYGVLEISRK